MAGRVAGMPLLGPARATFPVGWPLLPLDRVLGSRKGLVVATRVLDGPDIRAASDHRPLAATLRLRSAIEAA